MPAPVHLDLSELIANPLRSGIQREAIRHWPGPAPLLPCMVDTNGGLLALPESVLTVLGAEDDGTPAARAAERSALAQAMAAAKPLPDNQAERLLNLELFYRPERAEAYLRLASGSSVLLWYVYDFLPFLLPGLFPPGTTRHCMHFLRALRAASRVAFLSERTRQNYTSRVARIPSQLVPGPVLSPGADGLRLERQTFTPCRRDFVCIGTVEPRKNTQALLDAFQALWDRGSPARLVVAGRIAPEATGARDFFARHTDNPRLLVLDQPADETLRDVLRQARAVVMPSEAEGFGLPPYEALHAGIPAIASAELPSVGLLPAGVRLLRRMDPSSIAEAVEALLDDAEAARLWNEAAGVRLPTWASFGRELGEWAQAA
jgi:glycosyltransferase involved in cell wall biosynthesis